MNRLLAWLTPVRTMGIAAMVAGVGLIALPSYYDNPGYRVIFAHVSARPTGVLWLIVGALALTGREWAIAVLGTALLAWGLALGAAAWTEPRSGSPTGPVWYMAWGIVTLRQLATGAIPRLRN